MVRYTYFTYFRGRDIRGVFHVFSLRPAGPWRVITLRPPAHDASIRERSLSHLPDSDTIPLILPFEMFELTELKTNSVFGGSGVSGANGVGVKAAS